MKKMQISNIVIPLRLFLFLLVSIFMAEFLIMLFLDYVRIPSKLANSLLDSTLLVVILYPILYKFVFRNMMITLKGRKYLNERLSKINEELEAKIRVRTSNLVSTNQELQEAILGCRQTETNLEKAYLQLKETQNQLIQSEKLSAIGQLASGVAHEVRNPLSIILQGVEYLEIKIPPKETPAREALSMIKDSVKRADKIISLLFDFSKAARLNLMPEDINSILESSINLVETKVKFMNIDIVKETKKDIPKTMIDKNRMEQVFINLLLNAIQAMPEGGKVIIRTYEKRLEAPANRVGERKEDYFKVGEKAVIVEIEDTGTGIPEENLNKIFDPFFTTKGIGGGTGLGLSVSQSIIIMHKGLIDVTSQLGKGTRITVTLHAIE